MPLLPYQGDDHFELNRHGRRGRSRLPPRVVGGRDGRCDRRFRLDLAGSTRSQSWRPRRSSSAPGQRRPRGPELVPEQCPRSADHRGNVLSGPVRPTVSRTVERLITPFRGVESHALRCAENDFARRPGEGQARPPVSTGPRYAQRSLIPGRGAAPHPAGPRPCRPCRRGPVVGRHCAGVQPRPGCVGVRRVSGTGDGCLASGSHGEPVEHGGGHAVLAVMAGCGVAR